MTLTTQNENAAYAAGLIDGEGCFYIGKDSRAGTFALSFSISMTDKTALEWLKEHFGGYRVSHLKTLPSGKKYYGWALYGQDVEKFLASGVFKFLKIKRKQAIIALNFLNTKHIVGGEKFWMEMREANK